MVGSSAALLFSSFFLPSLCSRCAFTSEFSLSLSPRSVRGRGGEAEKKSDLAARPYVRISPHVLILSFSYLYSIVLESFIARGLDPSCLLLFNSQRLNMGFLVHDSVERAVGHRQQLKGAARPFRRPGDRAFAHTTLRSRRLRCLCAVNERASERSSEGKARRCCLPTQLEAASAGDAGWLAGGLCMSQ